MAALQHRAQLSKPKPHYFLSCFGQLKAGKSSEIVKSGRRRRILSFSMFRLKQRRSIAGKTVPMEAAAVLEEEDNNFSPTPPKSTSKSKPRPLAGGEPQQPPSDLKPVASDKTLDEKYHRNWSEHVQKGVLENGKSLQNSHSLKSSTHPTSEIFRRRHDPVGTKEVISQLSLPVEFFINRKPTMQSLSPSTLQPELEKYPTAEDSSRKKVFDPMIGMCILTLPLLITLPWGKLCAIICTSAWLYMLPRRSWSSSSELKKSIEETSQNLKITKIDDDLYKNLKKKVVFEGFLKRSRRSRQRIHSRRTASLV